MLNKNLEYLKGRLDVDPNDVIEVLRHNDDISFEELKLLIRALVKLKKFASVYERLKNNKLYKKDNQLLNLYLNSLKNLKKWHDIIELQHILLFRNDESNATLIRAHYKNGNFAECADLIKQIGSSDNVKYNYIAFCNFAKLMDVENATLFINLIASNENDNVFQWSDLTENELRNLSSDKTGLIASELSKILFKNGKFLDVISVLKPFLENLTTASSRIYNYTFRYYCESLCNVLDRQSLVLELRRVIKIASRIDSLDDFSILYEAHLTFLENGLDISANKFNQFDANSSGCLPSDKGALTVRDSVFISNLKIMNDYIDVVFHDGHESLDIKETVTVVASDSKYFLMFNEVYSKSFFAHNPEKNLHFHVVNPSDEVRKRITELSKSFSRLIGFSFSTVCVNQNVKPYYAALRFLITPHLLKHYGCSLLITDIDVGFSNKIDLVTACKDDYDVLFKMRKNVNLFPWRWIPANTLIVNNTEKAINYIELFNAYFLSLYDNGGNKNLWWIDQAALYSLYNSKRDNNDICRFGNLYDLSDVGALLEFHQPFEDKTVFLRRLSKGE